MAFIDLIKYFTGNISPLENVWAQTCSGRGRRRDEVLPWCQHDVLYWGGAEGKRVLTGKDPSVRHTRLFITVTHRIRFAVLMPRELRGLLWADAVWTKCVTALGFFWGAFFYQWHVHPKLVRCVWELHNWREITVSYSYQLCCRENGKACNWLRLVIDSCSMTRRQQWFRK